MIGLLFLCFLAAWFTAAWWLAKKLAGKFANGQWRLAAICLLTLLFVTLPLTDEIIGGFQFRALCKKNEVFKVDEEKIKGKTVRSVVDPSNKDIDGVAVRIYYSHFSYRDVQTDEELASYTRYVAHGGWLIRALSRNQNMTPLTFESTCDPTPQTDYGFKLIY